MGFRDIRLKNTWDVALLIKVSLTYLRGQEIPELNEEDMPVI